MKKFVLLAAFVATLALSLCACDKDREPVSDVFIPNAASSSDTQDDIPTPTTPEQTPSAPQLLPTPQADEPDEEEVSFERLPRNAAVRMDAIDGLPREEGGEELTRHYDEGGEHGEDKDGEMRP